MCAKEDNEWKFPTNPQTLTLIWCRIVPRTKEKKEQVAKEIII
jgi:hypothetical protein